MYIERSVLIRELPDGGYVVTMNGEERCAFSSIAEVCLWLEAEFRADEAEETADDMPVVLQSHPQPDRRRGLFRIAK